MQQYPGLKLLTIRPSDDDRDKAFAETQTILKVYPTAKLIMAIAAPAVPGAGEAIRQAGRSDVFVIGLSLPNLNKRYVHDGNVQEFLQNTDKEKSVVVYCYHGNNSLGATGFLIENGFKNVASMSGGFEAWRQVYEHEALK